MQEANFRVETPEWSELKTVFTDIVEGSTVEGRGNRLGGKEAVRKQIGMVVPPLGAKVIVEAILKTFDGIPYNSVETQWTFNNSEEEVIIVKNKLKEQAEKYVLY